ncbi:MAG: hypothetical protein WDO56_11785 [Gammaproteobacteria bacterium]
MDARNSPDEQDFEAAMRYAGHTVPPERTQGALAVYAELRRMAQLQRQPRDAESEPAAVFSLLAFGGSDGAP